MSSAINLDGKLDEPSWHEAPVATLVQQSPRPGAPTAYTTEIRVLISDDALYFGFVCHDPRPEAVAVHTMRRDGDLTGDDTVSVVLDTYGDRHTGYFFQINAAGARVDGLVSDAENASLDWDGIWNARTARSGEGWSAEIIVPSRTLNFTRGLGHWGANFERFVPREQLTLRWASPTLDSFRYDFNRAGQLTSVETLQQGKGIDVAPYATGRTKRAFGVSARAWQAAEGGEITWKITPQLVSVFTVNTDFAETEVDARQINLTRFPLFFPEKRTFFLEGSNQYKFGLGLDTQFIPFFSRRVGLVGSTPIPIDGGVKLSGRVGKWSLTLLDVQTRGITLPQNAAKELKLPSGDIGGTNLLAGRVSYDFNENLRIGSIFTNGDPEGLRRNTLLGVDAVWRTTKFRGNKNLQVGGWTATTQGDVGHGSRSGWGAKVDYPNDLWDCAATVHQFGDALEPLLGFLPRAGVRHSILNCRFQPRPSKEGRLRWVRQFFVENYYHRFTNSRGMVESWEYLMSPLGMRLESGEHFEFDFDSRGERLLTPFEIAPGVIIAPGSYQFTRLSLIGETSSHRRLQFGNTTEFGGFYGGSLTHQINYAKSTLLGGRLELRADAEEDFARLPAGNFVQKLWQFQGGYAWSPNLVLTSFIQYDTTTQNVGTNTRLRWTITPGSDLFIVWNRGWQRLATTAGLSLIPQTDLVAIKLRWTFRF